jgi:hypothetical protein
MPIVQLDSVTAQSHNPMAVELYESSERQGLAAGVTWRVSIHPPATSGSQL